MSMEFFKQEYWSGLPFPSPGDLPNPGIGPRSPESLPDLSSYHTSGKEPAANAGDIRDMGLIPGWKIPWRRAWQSTLVFLGFRISSDYKESTCNVGNLDSVSGLGRSPGGGHGNPLQYSCLENPYGQRSLVGYSPWGHKELDTTEQLSTAHGPPELQADSLPCEPPGKSTHQNG